MIQFEILESPDQEAISTFEYFHNLIYIGRTSGNITIQDHSLLSSHLMIEVLGNEVIVHPQKDVEFYLINGKRATTPRKIKVNDRITIGKTILKLTSFAETPEQSKKDVLNQKLQELIDTGSQKLNVVESLTKLSR